MMEMATLSGLWLCCPTERKLWHIPVGGARSCPPTVPRRDLALDCAQGSDELLDTDFEYLF